MGVMKMWNLRTGVVSVVSGLLAAALLLPAACAQELATEEPTAPATVTIAPRTHEVIEGEIHVYGVHTETSLIRFSGTAGLPDGTVLRSQLYKDGTLVPWWPTGQDIPVHDGQWTISAALGDDGRPREILVGPVYRVDVWERDDPAQHGGFSFDLVGPPPVSQ